MLETVRSTLIALSVVSWVSAAVFVVTILRVQLGPGLRRTLRHLAQATSDSSC